MAIVLDETSTAEHFLNYALFAGAVFQLICIFAVIMIPISNDENKVELVTSPVNTANQSSSRSHDSSNRRVKKEKKKHR